MLAGVPVALAALAGVLLARGSQAPRAVAPPRAVAILAAGGNATAVDGAGRVLGAGAIGGSLPTLAVSRLPARGRLVPGSQLHRWLAVLGAAPAPLLAMVEKVYEGKEGLTVQMKNGLQAYFGDASRPRAKWDSLAAVLADPASAGAFYVDVRLPERPAAGMGPEGGGLQAEPSTTAATSTTLTESLARAVSGGVPIESSGASTPMTPEEEAAAGAAESSTLPTPETATEPGALSPSETATAPGG